MTPILDLGQLAYESFWPGQYKHNVIFNKLVPETKQRWAIAAHAVKDEVEKPLLQRIAELEKLLDDIQTVGGI